MVRCRKNDYDISDLRSHLIRSSIIFSSDAAQHDSPDATAMNKRRRDGSPSSIKPIPATRSLQCKKAAAKWLMVAGVMIGLTAPGWAEEVDAGKVEYLTSCAPCHGTDGKGKGPLSSKLKAKPADLTTFAKKNNGVFPLGAVYEAIDGRNVTGSHDAREMPIWGCRHTPSSVSPTRTKRKVYRQPDRYESHLDLSCDPEDVIGNRVLSVVEYLRRIQEK
jgi:mono/diheme cytochrome c family protein